MERHLLMSEVPLHCNVEASATCRMQRRERASLVHSPATGASGPICPEAGLHIPRRAYLSRGGPIYPEAGLFIPRRTYLTQFLRLSSSPHPPSRA